MLSYSSTCFEMYLNLKPINYLKTLMLTSLGFFLEEANLCDIPMTISHALLTSNADDTQKLWRYLCTQDSPQGICHLFCIYVKQF